jgi:3-deoxy-D-manno-octulosonate cytidylyltransferase
VKLESAIAIIPARFQSTRLPGKPVIEIQGKTLIEHVYRRVQCAKSIERILIATDDELIADAVRKFGGEVVMTRLDHQSGTDRLAEAAAHLPSDTLVVNIQGDEPLIEPDVIDRAVAAARPRDAQIVTVMTTLSDPAAIADPNRVKVVVDRNGFALYFSRSPIPHGSSGGLSSGTTFLHLGCMCIGSSS